MVSSSVVRWLLLLVVVQGQREGCPFKRKARFVLNVAVTTSDLPPIRDSVGPLLARLEELVESTLEEEDHAAVLVLVDSFPDKSRSAVSRWWTRHAHSLRGYEVELSRRLGGRHEVHFELVRPHTPIGREALRSALGGRPCDDDDDDDASFFAHHRTCGIVESSANELWAPTAEGCANVETRCVRADRLGSTLPYLWATLRSLKCGAEYMIHYDGDVIIGPRPSQRRSQVRRTTWATRAAEILDANDDYYALHLIDLGYPYGRPCAVSLQGADCTIKCPQSRVDEFTRDWRGVILKREAGEICGSAMVASRVMQIDGVGTAAAGVLRHAAHLSLEAFILSPKRFVARWPLDLAAADLELALEVSSSTANGSFVLPSDFLGIDGKMADQFFHGASYKHLPVVPVVTPVAPNTTLNTTNGPHRRPRRVDGTFLENNAARHEKHHRIRQQKQQQQQQQQQQQH